MLSDTVRLVVLQGQVTWTNIPRLLFSCLLWTFHSSLRRMQLCCLRKGSLVLPESAFLWCCLWCMLCSWGTEGKVEKSVSFNTKSSFAQSHELLKKLNPSQEGVFTVISDIWSLRAPVWSPASFHLSWTGMSDTQLRLISTASSFAYLTLGRAKFKL